MDAPLDPTNTRRAELVTSLAAVRARLSTAAEAVGRDPRSVTLIAVTKTFPAQDVALLAELGVHDVGENREQEARRKVAELAELAPSTAGALRWHFVGQLQTNKARSVARYAAAVHSVDRPELAGALADAAGRQGRRPLDVFVQVDLQVDLEAGAPAGDGARGGADPAAVPALVDHVLSRPELRLRGVMAVAPLGVEPDAAFTRLAAVSEEVRAAAPQAVAISAGMSGDLESAVRHGATHLRIGSALLGHRGPFVG